MIDSTNLKLPNVLQGITSTTEDLELTMGNELRFGSLLRTLAASMVGSRVLQLGTGSGFLTAWLLDGMAAGSELVGIEPDTELAAVASRFLSRDQRLKLLSGDWQEQLSQLQPGFTLAVASSPSALTGQLRETMQLLAPGGLLVAGGLTEREDWTGNDRQEAQNLLDRLELHGELRLSVIDWASGVAIATRIPGTAG